MNKYIQELRNALRSAGAHDLYFPSNIAERKVRNLRLARELAFGLQDFDRDEVNNILSSLYGMLIVANSLDNTGVAIDNKEWLNEIITHCPPLSS